MYSRALTKGLFIFTLLFIIAAYGSVATEFKLPMIGEQWMVLASIVVILTSFFGLFGTIFTIAMYFEADKDCRQANLKMYELLNDKVISPCWHWFYLLSAIGFFQIKHYGNAFVTIVLFIFIITFRMAHQKVVRKAEIQVLNGMARKK